MTHGCFTVSRWGEYTPSSENPEWQYLASSGGTNAGSGVLAVGDARVADEGWEEFDGWEAFGGGEGMAEPCSEVQAARSRHNAMTEYRSRTFLPRP